MRKEKVEQLYKRSGYYHIYNRGNRKQNIFLREKDYKIFINLLYKYLKKKRLLLIGYCLMPNHFHLIIKNGADIRAIPDFMQCFMTAYVMYFNRHYKKVGRLFQSPFQAKRLPKIRDLENAKRYLELNPFEAGMPIRKIKKGYKWLYLREKK